MPQPESMQGSDPGMGSEPGHISRLKADYTVMETNGRIISLETKIAYLEHYVQELNQVVLDQDKTIKRLLSETDAIKRQLEEKKEKLPENEKPPHY